TRSPVAVDVDGRLIELTPEHLTSVSTVEPRQGALVPEMDGEALAALVLELDPVVRPPARDACLHNPAGHPTLVPSAPAKDLDEEVLVAEVARAATSADDRTAQATLREVDPEFTVADAEALGVTEVVSEFSTPFHNDPQRTRNLITGAEKISNTLVKPGETF